jgi:hypothetical protein
MIDGKPEGKELWLTMPWNIAQLNPGQTPKNETTLEHKTAKNRNSRIDISFMSTIGRSWQRFAQWPDEIEKKTMVGSWTLDYLWVIVCDRQAFYRGKEEVEREKLGRFGELMPVRGEKSCLSSLEIRKRFRPVESSWWENHTASSEDAKTRNDLPRGPSVQNIENISSYVWPTEGRRMRGFLSQRGSFRLANTGSAALQLCWKQGS